jgi:Ca2+-binding RTX toxin-like protein
VLRLSGVAGPNAFSIMEAANGVDLLLTHNGVTTTILNYADPLSLDSSILVEGGIGTDSLTVDVANGLILLPILFNGGAGSDVLTIVDTGPGLLDAASQYFVGPEVGSGRHVLSADISIQTIHFTGLEPVIDLVPAILLAVIANDADNAFTYSDDGAGRGVVGVDGFERIIFANKDELALNGQGGADTFTLRNSPSSSGLNTIRTLGESGSDRMVVHGTGFQNAATYNPIGVHNGFVAITGSPNAHYFAVEAVEYVGAVGGDTLNIVIGGISPATANFTPGPAFDAGNVRVSNLGEFSYSSLGSGLVTVTGFSGSDELIYNGSDGSDFFAVNSTGLISLLNSIEFLPVQTVDVAFLSLNGFNGNDEFDIAANHPFDGILVDGGDPSASDSLDVDGTGGPITVDFNSSSVTEDGFGPIFYIAVEHIDVDAAGAVVTVLGIAENEVYEIVSTGPNSSRLISFGHPIVEVDNGTLVVDTDGGIDAIEFFGTEAADVIVVTATDVTINGAVIGYANAAAIIVSGLGGNDLITINSLSVPTTVRGGEGDDQILGGAAAAVAGVTPVLYGDDGNDIINGTQGSDMIFAGDGNDIAFGDGGFDIFFGGADSDRFIWLPGDGDDLIEGGTGEDTLQFDGNNNDEIFTMTAVGTRLLFQRDLGGIDIDAADFETVQLNTQGQVDRVFINDLTQTAVRVVNVNLQGGLGANNFVTVRGRQLADDIFISNSGIGSVLIAGLRYDINVLVAQFNFDFITVEGLGGDDTIKASAGLDFNSFAITLDGGEGDDFLSADATLIGGAGDDVLVGGAGNDSITGGAGNDTLFSGTGDDILQGDEGNDVFHLEGGTKTVEGGSPFDNGFDIITVVGTAGPDVVTVSGLANPITIDLNANPNFVTVSEIDRIDITTFEEADEIGYISFIPGRIHTGDGNDVVDAAGSEAAVSVFGGQGNDLLVGGTVNDTILGESGNDTIQGGPGDDFLEGGDGSDTFRTGIVDGEDVIEGGSGNDVAILQGSSASDNDFDVFNDNIRLAAIVLSGTTTAAIDAADVEQLDLIGGTGVDDVNILDLWLTDVILVNVDLSGGLGPDASMDCVCVNGRNVADDIAVVLNDATLDIQVEGLKAQVDIDNYSPLDTLAIKANAGNDTIAIIPPVLELIQVQVFGGFGNDVIEGASQADGDAGGDTLIGTDGPDTLIGGPGDDLIIGLAGNDLLIGDGDIIPPPLGDCCGPFIPTPVGGFGNDTIFGDAGDDSISGTGGNDVENGGDGNDLMGILVVGPFTFNDPGNDTIHGDAGNDSIQSDTGDDVVFGDSGIDFIDGGADNDNIDGGSEDDRILGNTGNDTVQGGTGNDLIYGFTGNDVLAGGDGSDTICGEEGDDILSGEGGGDLLISGVGNDFAMGGDASDTIFGGLGNDALLGDAGDDFLFGNDGNDFIMGGDGNDVAFGTTGDDSILGGLGNDSLYGGDGFDSIHGGDGPIRAPHTRPPGGNDGNDLILGGDGFDQVDGGSGNNVIDAGADGFREIILAGRGRDVGYRHAELGTGPNGLSDVCALDGGHNICVHVGELIEPFSPEEPPCDSSGLTVFNIGAVIPPVGQTFTDPIELPILFIPSVHGSTPIEFPPGVFVPPPHVLRRMDQALRRNSKKGKETPKSTAAKPRGVLSFWRANSKKNVNQGAANQRAGR